MSDNFKIGNYSFATNEIKTILSKANLTENEMKALDTNSDKTISEDEFVEVVNLIDDTSYAQDADFSNDPTIQSLQNEYNKEMQDMYRYQEKLLEYRRNRAEVRSELAQYGEEDDPSNLEAKLDEIDGKIDEANSKIVSCISNMFSINMSIQDAKNAIIARQQQAQAQAQAQAAAQAQMSAAGVQNTGAVANTAGVQGTSNSNLQAQAGSGASLASVTGDMSICLDRVAQSLGTSRQGAADYITTLCNTVGEGKIPPKIILSQIFSESSGIQSCTTTATSKFVGLGQMSEVAVKEINRQYGTNFTFEDMNDASKNLQAMVYLMKFQYNRYGGNIGAAITAYNVGHFSGTVNGYAQKIMARANA